MTPALPKARAEELIEAARDVAAHAHAPHSGYAVGAAVLTASGEIVTGCNVENASYGLTMCAERVAIFTARARGLVDREKMPIAAIAIVVLRPDAVPWPCGACRQVIAEFARDDAVVLVAAPDGTKEMRFGDLLPNAFRLEPGA